MPRTDISPYLIHFTRGQTEEEAFANLCKMIKEKRLRGSRKYIKGNKSVVCFSEAPIAHLQNGLVNFKSSSHYSLFGILVHKKWLFRQGGRPVIYQPDEDYASLPLSHQWRHVHFELRDDRQKKDFTWEREWRIPCDTLQFDEHAAAIVVPDASWRERLTQQHDRDQDYEVMHYSLLFGDGIAEAFRSSFTWKLIPLK